MIPLDVGRLFLADPRIRGPQTRAMVAAVAAWTQVECGAAGVVGNNPWNLHIGPDCASTAGFAVPGYNHSQVLVSGTPGLLGNRYAGPGDRNVAIFDTLEHGVAACVSNLARLWAPGEAIDYGYDRVIAAARAGDAPGFLAALAASSWCAGRYGTANGGPNVLVPVYQRFLVLVPEVHTVELAELEAVGIVNVDADATAYADVASTVVVISRTVAVAGVRLLARATRADGKPMCAVLFTDGTRAWLGADRVRDR